MKSLLIFCSFLIIFLASSEASQLVPFNTDYCTSYPEGTIHEPRKWAHCCLIHDLFLWAGGKKAERDEADLGLKSCVEKTGEVNHANLIYLGVRVGSYSPIKFPNKVWGNGWRDRAKYQALSSEEIDRIEAEIYSGYIFISPEIKNDFLYKLRSRLD